MSDQHPQYETVSAIIAERDSARKELAAARALLREQLAQDDDVMSDMQILGFVDKMPKDAVELSERIRSYLDASDKQGGGHV